MSKAMPAALALIGLAASTPALGDYVINIEEVGGNVVGTGSGSLDLSALTAPQPTSSTPGFRPVAVVGIGDLALVDTVRYDGGVGSPAWGPAVLSSPDLGSGPLVAAQFDLVSGRIVVPAGYVSGTPLGPGTMTFLGRSLADLGIVPGSYTMIWGLGARSDSLTLNIRQADPIPEPATWAMMLLGFAALGTVLRGRRARQAAARATG